MPMKSTGIIRRIDDLGRVVIPKEIRRTCGIHEGDPLEIWLDNDCVVFKRYDAATGSKLAIERALDDIRSDWDLDNATRQDVVAKLKEAIAVLDGSRKE